MSKPLGETTQVEKKEEAQIIWSKKEKDDSIR